MVSIVPSACFTVKLPLNAGAVLTSAPMASNMLVIANKSSLLVIEKTFFDILVK